MSGRWDEKERDMDKKNDVPTILEQAGLTKEQVEKEFASLSKEERTQVKQLFKDLSEYTSRMQTKDDSKCDYPFVYATLALLYARYNDFDSTLIIVPFVTLHCKNNSVTQATFTEMVSVVAAFCRARFDPTLQP
jgi:hypothetical protein